MVENIHRTTKAIFTHNIQAREHGRINGWTDTAVIKIRQLKRKLYNQETT